MKPEGNKALYRGYIDEAWNKGNIDAIKQFFAPTYVDHFLPPDEQINHIEMLTFIVVMARDGFPDATWTIEDMIAEGDKVASQITMRGTHLGSYEGVAPTGQRVEVQESHTARFVDGKIVEQWHLIDRLGCLQQLGLATLGPTATP